MAVRGTVRNVATPRPRHAPSSPKRPVAVMCLRPLCAICHATSTHRWPTDTSPKSSTWNSPRRIASSGAGTKVKEPGQSSTAHTNSGDTRPPGKATRASGTHGQATFSLPSSGPANMPRPSPGKRSVPHTKQRGNQCAVNPLKRRDAACASSKLGHAGGSSASFAGRAVARTASPSSKTTPASVSRTSNAVSSGGGERSRTTAPGPSINCVRHPQT